jgi:hypothetical protein
VEQPVWPDADINAVGTGADYWEGAAICRRGHVETSYVKPGDELRALPERCPKCGAAVLVACPTCNLRIRGVHFTDALVTSAPPRPSFCDGCGAAFPWATREERIYELENLLDEEEIDDADRVVISDNLRRLREEQTLSEREEKALWTRVKGASGNALKSEHVARVVEGLVSAAIRAQLGI